MPAMDYAEHERTYAGFIKVTKWGIATVVIIVALMAIFLT
ncbi:aa3-type cytochrome c oxidase subunit IV [Amorphus coralli]|nr:aa3-type cytochrome c oxidase subunit IV [Amorphus coralli]